MYVARFTNNPEEDVKRGWSGYMGSYSTPTECADFLGVDVEGMDDETIIDLLLDQENTDLRFDAVTEEWRVWHHDGLSCWELEAETVEDAITEAAKRASNDEIAWGGFGQRTLGKVSLVCKVEGINYLYVLECEDTCDEH